MTGSEGLSVDRLAEKIGVTKRTVYRHYKSKSGLIIAVVSREVERLCQEISRPVGGEEGSRAISVLHNWTKTFFDYAIMPEALAFFRYLNFEAARDTRIRQQNDQWISALHDHICTMIRAAQDEGSLRSSKPIRLAILLLDLTISFTARGRWTDHVDKFGGDNPSEYFSLRWAAFMSLAGVHHWSQFNQIVDRDSTGPISQTRA
jgi:AcrR family transcriptional regulator